MTATADNTIVELPEETLIELGEKVLAVHPQAGNLSPITHGHLQTLRDSPVQSKEREALMSALRAWLAANGDAIAELYPGDAPPFDHLQTYWSNFYSGPRVASSPIPLERERPTFNLLGLPLGIPFGVPACAVTPHSGYVEYFASRGFDLITYKTVRGGPWNPHRSPNLAFAAGVRQPLSEAQLNDPVLPTMHPDALRDIRRASFVNSIGVPSLPVAQWQADVARSRSMLSDGQALIVSVMGSPETLRAQDDAGLVQQFTEVAADAKDAGAQIVELNLSCPNTGGTLICLDAELSSRICAAVRARIGDTPLLIKISHMSETKLSELVRSCQESIGGVVAINAVQVHAQDAAGAAFFKGRPNDHAGLSGAGIRELGLEVTRTLSRLRGDEGPSPQDWAIISIGGVASAADYQAYRDAGADAVQSCTGAWLNQRLAEEVREQILGVKAGTSQGPRVSVNGDGSGPEHQGKTDHPWRRLFHSVNDTVRAGGLNLRVEEPRTSPGKRRRG
jgi:dihydroorotate dehydrogenase